MPTPWLLGLAWGALAAVVPLAGSRRRAPARRAAGLAGPRSRPVARRRPAARVAADLAGPVGRVARDVLVRRRARSEAAHLERELPVVTDLLAVAVGAGCTPFVAVECARRWAPPRSARLLDGVVRACELGAAPAIALEELGCRAAQMRPLVDALLASDRLGAPVGPALDRLAAEQRTALRRRAEARARAVPVRLLFPLVFLVLPAFAVLTVAPALLGGIGRL